MRTIYALAVVAALAGTTPAHGLGGSARTVHAEYVTSGGVSGVISGDTSLNGSHYGSAVIFTRRAERTMDVKVTDAAGLPVAVEIKQDSDGDGTSDLTLAEFCGAKKGVRIAHPGVDVWVFPVVGACGTSPSAPTQGTVVATLRK